jgi:hypothetical protein
MQMYKRKNIKVVGYFGNSSGFLMQIVFYLLEAIFWKRLEEPINVLPTFLNT